MKARKKNIKALVLVNFNCNKNIKHEIERILVNPPIYHIILELCMAKPYEK